MRNTRLSRAICASCRLRSAHVRRLLDGAPHRRRQARQVVLQHIVHGTGVQRRDGALLADGARHEHERQLGPQLRARSAAPTCRRTAAARNPTARRSGSNSSSAARSAGSVSTRRCVQSTPSRSQLVQLALDVDIQVFDKEDAYGLGLFVLHRHPNAARSESFRTSDCCSRILAGSSLPGRRSTVARCVQYFPRRRTAPGRRERDALHIHAPRYAGRHSHACVKSDGHALHFRN